MPAESIRAKVAELRDHQQALQAVTTSRNEGWRRELVDRRRHLAITLGELASLIAAQSAVQSFDMVRRSVSSLRTKLAEHQALWPAVSIDPADPSYIASANKVRGAYRDLDTALMGLDPSPPPETEQ